MKQWTVHFFSFAAVATAFQGRESRRPPLERSAQFGGRSGCCVKADSYLSTLSRRATDRGMPCEKTDWQRSWMLKLDASLRRLTGEGLLEAPTSEACARLFRDEDLVVVSHDCGTGDDGPVFNFATSAALALWESTWDQFVALPSKYSAEEDERDARAAFLAAVQRHGFTRDYSGIRVSRTGKRFRIVDAVVWNVLDDDGSDTRLGQAAMFRRGDVEYLP